MSNCFYVKDSPSCNTRTILTAWHFALPARKITWDTLMIIIATYMHWGRRKKKFGQNSSLVSDFFNQLHVYLSGATSRSVFFKVSIVHAQGNTWITKPHRDLYFKICIQCDVPQSATKTPARCWERKQLNTKLETQAGAWIKHKKVVNSNVNRPKKVKVRRAFEKI